MDITMGEGGCDRKNHNEGRNDDMVDVYYNEISPIKTPFYIYRIVLT